ncbi:hypothetical protein A2856_03015 [Candidatus Uhrbacteria bacterium RIFCSPHIGHO2_01_FULL_63_20]|uniref:Uncharacterized protein n=1 Tax=Candidatus Uhrbacteria bacterium RIFCSPHIGHO2_01_FULL_63_20 TaxID=1802385 RepID=A0A1F7TL53_9BACT|nr:MAG: hypothetical protein A2856_03015 [Candidatus Uhrbacteria bacterium RIFCSPHIGHO2_01_FULL_63_20]
MQKPFGNVLQLSTGKAVSVIRKERARILDVVAAKLLVERGKHSGLVAQYGLECVLEIDHGFLDTRLEDSLCVVLTNGRRAQDKRLPADWASGNPELRTRQRSRQYVDEDGQRYLAILTKWFKGLPRPMIALELYSDRKRLFRKPWEDLRIAAQGQGDR